MDTFDLSCCHICMDKNDIYITPSYFQDVRDKEFRMHRINKGKEYTHLRRVLKYLRRGYRARDDLQDSFFEPPTAQEEYIGF